MTFDIPNKDGLWVFNSPMQTTNWQTWVKPTQYNTFVFYVCGAGGGGSGGGQTPSAALGGSGGGGGCLAVANIPTYLLPETLYIQIGLGGVGGTGAGGLGANGGSTYVAYYPNTNAANLLFSCGGGTRGTNSVGGAGGTGTIVQSIFSYSLTTGGAGTAGGNSAAGGNYSVTTSAIYGGTGAGGKQATGGIAFAAGSIIASNIHPQLDGGAVGGINGSGGYLIKKPFSALGGTGGGGNMGGAGGRGGDGVWGSGGGGGGAGTGATSIAGRGGDGFVIIIGY